LYESTALARGQKLRTFLHEKSPHFLIAAPSAALFIAQRGYYRSKSNELMQAEVTKPSKEHGRFFSLGAVISIKKNRHSHLCVFVDLSPHLFIYFVITL
jgi:hypothetical protein